MAASLIGVIYCGVTPALVVCSTSPIVGAIVARILYKEKLGVRVIIGMCIAISGIVIIGWVTPTGNYPHFMLGIGISALASIGWGVEGALASYAADMTDSSTAVGFFRIYAQD